MGCILEKESTVPENEEIDRSISPFAFLVDFVNDSAIEDSDDASDDGAGGSHILSFINTMKSVQSPAEEGTSEKQKKESGLCRTSKSAYKKGTLLKHLLCLSWHLCQDRQRKQPLDWL